MLFSNIRERIDKITKEFSFDKKLNLDDIDNYQELTKAYIVLIHAELEKYFELLSLSIIKNAINEYRQSGQIAPSLLALCSSNLFSFTYPKLFDDDNIKDYNSIEKKLNQNYTKLVERIKANNGITEKYLIKILWPIGVEKDDLDDSLLHLLGTLANSRGRIAHTGLTINKTLLNYEQETKNIYMLLDEVEKFEKQIKIKLNYKDTNDSNIEEYEMLLIS